MVAALPKTSSPIVLNNQEQTAQQAPSIKMPKTASFNTMNGLGSTAGQHTEGQTRNKCDDNTAKK
ncbi:MAG: hypothetical protein ACMZI0_01785 [Symbiopectobacterium sp.]|uniref:hypothetical protein n=1 Tax=Symbiopectobacterium sp. TaxID=2952789 RepID=UPI0039EAE137